MYTEDFTLLMFATLTNRPHYPGTGNKEMTCQPEFSMHSFLGGPSEASARHYERPCACQTFFYFKDPPQFDKIDSQSPQD